MGTVLLKVRGASNNFCLESYDRIVESQGTLVNRGSSRQPSPDLDFDLH